MRAAAGGLVAALLLAPAPVAFAQVARNGLEWGGKDHQPTQAGVVGREDQAGVRAPPAQQQQNGQTVQQLDGQLLNTEAVDPPRDPDPDLVVTPSGKAVKQEQP